MQGFIEIKGWCANRKIMVVVIGNGVGTNYYSTTFLYFFIFARSAFVF